MALNKFTEPQKAFIRKLMPGQRATGVVRSFQDFGAFVSIGPVNGLLHNKNIRWARTTDPEEVLRKGQKIEVVILDVDYEKYRVSLGLKQLQPDPWDTFSENFGVGDKVAGTVTRVMPYGAILEIVPGVEGLLHRSQVKDTDEHDPGFSPEEDDVYEVQIVELDRTEKKLKVALV
jgi:ribosomal protein S1